MGRRPSASSSRRPAVARTDAERLRVAAAAGRHPARRGAAARGGRDLRAGLDSTTGCGRWPSPPTTATGRSGPTCISPTGWRRSCGRTAARCYAAVRPPGGARCSSAAGRERRPAVLDGGLPDFPVARWSPMRCWSWAASTKRRGGWPRRPTPTSGCSRPRPTTTAGPWRSGGWRRSTKRGSSSSRPATPTSTWRRGFPSVRLEPGRRDRRRARGGRAGARRLTPSWSPTGRSPPIAGPAGPPLVLAGPSGPAGPRRMSIEGVAPSLDAGRHLPGREDRPAAARPVDRLAALVGRPGLAPPSGPVTSPTS